MNDKRQIVKKRLSTHGKGRLKHKREPFYKRAKVVLGRPYELGGNGTEERAPIDCFGMVVEYAGLQKKAEKLKDYRDLYALAPDVAIKEMSDFLAKNLKKIEKGQMFIGDIMLCSYEGQLFTAINAGVTSAIVTTEHKGCILVNSSEYEIKEVFRCLP